MKAYIDPETNQVMAAYTHDTESSVWEDQGFERVDVDEAVENGINRDCVATIEDGTVVDVEHRENPEQPEPTPDPQQSKLEALEARIEALESR